jgi:hypothetical protein
MDSWDLGTVERSRRIPARECGGGLGVARRKKRKAGGGKGFGSGFIGEHGLVEEREREGQSRAGLRMASGAGVPLGCVAAARHRRPDVAARGTASGAARAVRGVVGRRVCEGRAVQTCNGSGSGRRRRVTRARQRQGKTMEDPNAKSKKARDPTVMHK